jgi:hypothetical protein
MTRCAGSQNTGFACMAARARRAAADRHDDTAEDAGRRPATRCRRGARRYVGDQPAQGRPVIADPAQRERLSCLGNRGLFRTCAGLSPLDGEDGGDDEDAVAPATRISPSLLPQRIEQLTGLAVSLSMDAILR